MNSEKTLDAFERIFSALIQHAADNASGESLDPAQHFYSDQYASSRPLIIRREDYHSGRVGPLVDRLMHFSDDSAECAKAFGSMDLRIVGASVPFLCRGPDDERIRKYFEKVSAHWPFWLHFLKPTPENLASLLHLVFEAHHVHLTGNQVRSQILLKESGMQKLHDLVTATLALHTQLQLDPRKTQQLGWDLKKSIRLILQ